jgi:hypothetical protein
VAKPTFNINDIVAPVGRQPANPFGLPTQAQQNPNRPPAAPRTVSAQEDVNQMLGQQPETGFLQPSAPTPTPSPTPQPKKRYAT